MYAIVLDRGKQYKVEEGQTVDLDLLDLPEGGSYEFGSVVLLSKEGDVRIGAPAVSGVKVRATVVDPERKGEKVRIFRYKRRDHFRKRKGHRQRYTRVRIEKIETQ